MRDAVQEVRNADGSKIDARRAHRHALIGMPGGIYGDQVGVAGGRLATERAAPGCVAASGRAVDPTRAIAACPGGIGRGAAGKRLELGVALGSPRANTREP